MWFWLVVFLLTTSLTIALVGEHLQHGRIRMRTLFVDSYQSLASSLLGAAITIIFVDSFVRRGDRLRRTAQILSALRRGSDEAGAAAIAELKLNGWLTDGSLISADMSRASLLGADLESAVLNDVDLTHARLAGVSLFGAKLHRANLSEADLQGANLTLADLREANLYKADLRGADLDGADLRGAVLRGSLVDAEALTRAITDARTTVP
ncbi:pentapeptide repeat-containing protein [Streptomyces europaeiscabiei]|uniref:pentapeptide repeat-containing protein n=1 Tax=Streptomyces europaeiscabiei TaxID=146819 RepID=UPI0029A9685F|nr:pentapeptide repeat-containing protein [Streptomyces europaeiscabiei]MDX2759259.1 pentapeptide repeat-containing protein [Streptomyces europaeiscabiei]